MEKEQYIEISIDLYNELIKKSLALELIGNVAECAKYTSDVMNIIKLLGVAKEVPEV